jgi:peptidoglycan/LPS O-acetylase OafA/YrhL
MINAALSIRLDMLRWVAALLVVLSHMRPLLFVDYEDVENQNSVLIKFFYFMTGFGHEAVMVFFVISGLLVGGVSANKFAERRFSARSYVVHRFARIYLVFLPALLAGYLLDTVGSTYLDSSGLYTHTGEYRFSADAVDRMGTVIALGNVVMLQEVFFPPLGSNGPLWSLAYEWWYYILFFCGLQMLLLRDCPWKQAAYGTVLTLSIFLLPLPILLWFPIWLTGVAVALCARLRFHVPRLLGYAFFWEHSCGPATIASSTFPPP